eukprot:Nk52_evm1s1995 gene=Nk52_evmTU1s1995
MGKLPSSIINRALMLQVLGSVLLLCCTSPCNGSSSQVELASTDPSLFAGDPHRNQAAEEKDDSNVFLFLSPRDDDDDFLSITFEDIKDGLSSFADTVKTGIDYAKEGVSKAVEYTKKAAGLASKHCDKAGGILEAGLGLFFDTEINSEEVCDAIEDKTKTVHSWMSTANHILSGAGLQRILGSVPNDARKRQKAAEEFCSKVHGEPKAKCMEQVDICYVEAYVKKKGSKCTVCNDAEGPIRLINFDGTLSGDEDLEGDLCAKEAHREGAVCIRYNVEKVKTGAPREAVEAPCHTWCTVENNSEERKKHCQRTAVELRETMESSLEIGLVVELAMMRGKEFLGQSSCNAIQSVRDSDDDEAKEISNCVNEGENKEFLKDFCEGSGSKQDISWKTFLQRKEAFELAKCLLFRSPKTMFKHLMEEVTGNVVQAAKTLISGDAEKKGGSNTKEGQGAGTPSSEVRTEEPTRSKKPAIKAPASAAAAKKEVQITIKVPTPAGPEEADDENTAEQR